MNRKNPNPDCPCTYPCLRHGNCDACRAYHHAQGGKTACERLGSRKPD